jgi:fatty acid desaturase
MEIFCIVVFSILALAMIVGVQMFCFLYFQTWADTLPTEKEKEEAWRDYNLLLSARDETERQCIMQMIMEGKQDEKTGNR